VEDQYRSIHDGKDIVKTDFKDECSGKWKKIRQIKMKAKRRRPTYKETLSRILSSGIHHRVVC
jgi:hypothetical protein